MLRCEVRAEHSFAEVNAPAKRFMSEEHFTVEGTLIQAWAWQKSFRAEDGSEDGDGTNFRGQKRSNKTHESTPDADGRLYKKNYGKESKLSYLGHALVENRNGLMAAAMVSRADGYAERDAALWILDEKQKDRARHITGGANKQSALAGRERLRMVEADRPITSREGAWDRKSRLAVHLQSCRA